jgi:alkanesulfonate monooxygenase SsuD/methylene tetrahydromethanopterin reductase-like flavin-dependent oxidoreductase (luciferase family)
MEIGVGLDSGLGLSFEDEAELSREAAKLGYESIWTPAGTYADPFLTCAWRWSASREVRPGGLTTGISVAAVATQTPLGFALSAGTVSKLTEGRFILGVGTGGAYQPRYRETYGLRETSSLKLMRDYVTAIRALVNGEAVTAETKSFHYKGVRLTIDPPPRTPVYLGALGPEMVRLGGEVADGLSLNWCSAEQVAWSRERVAEGAARSGRDPAAVKISEYIRVCVDDDVDVARRAYVRAMMGYALGSGPDAKGRPQGYRAHFERMGYAEDLAAIDAMRAKNAPPDEVLDAFPAELSLAVGYYGRPDGAAAHFGALARGLDTAIVRVVAARPGLASVRAVMEACKPAVVGANA